MDALFAVRFESHKEDQVYLVSGSGENFWEQLQRVLAEVSDLDDFDCLILRRLQKTNLLKNPVSLSPSSKITAQFVERRNHKN